jgi:hypothetical protein
MLGRLSNWLRGLHVPKSSSHPVILPALSLDDVDLHGQCHVSATHGPVAFTWRPKYWVPAALLAAAVAETPIIAVRFTVNRYLFGEVHIVGF